VGTRYLDVNQRKLSKLLAEHKPARASQPAVEDSRIDPPEIDRMTGIAVLKFGQVGVRPVESRMNSRPGEEHRRGGAVVGSPAGVFGKPAAELREGEQDHSLLLTRALEVFKERGQRLTELRQKSGMRFELVLVGVESVELNIVNRGR
jgi:alkanesulfonate monooxygenase SsuD/methylene tetrahydromethanopterin reductase-like flavin-dependent oxidoreductase (luciferase family)